jgi:hypothetical protein
LGKNMDDTLTHILFAELMAYKSCAGGGQGPAFWTLNALWLLLGIAFAAVVFGVLTYIGRRWRP